MSCEFLRWQGCSVIIFSLEDTILLVTNPLNVRATLKKGTTLWTMLKMLWQMISSSGWSMTNQKTDLQWKNAWVIPSSGPMKGREETLIHRSMNINVCIKFQGNPSSSCREISLKPTNDKSPLGNHEFLPNFESILPRDLGPFSHWTLPTPTPSRSEICLVFYRWNSTLYNFCPAQVSSRHK